MENFSERHEGSEVPTSKTHMGLHHLNIVMSDDFPLKIESFLQVLCKILLSPRNYTPVPLCPRPILDALLLAIL